MEKNKILISVVLSLLLIVLFVGSAFAFTMPTSSPMDSSGIVVTLLNQDPDPVEPGQIVDLRFRVENRGTTSFNDLQIEVIPNFPLSLYGDSARKNLGSIDSSQIGEKAYIVKYSFRVSDNAEPGIARLNIRYSTDNWKTFVERRDFPVRVSDLSPVVELISAKTIPDFATPGEDIKLLLEVKSLARSEIRDVKLSLDLVDSDLKRNYFAPIGSTNQKIIELLSAGETRTIEFDLATSTDAPINVERLSILMTYRDNEDNIFSKDYLVGIKIFEEPSYTFALEDRNIYKENQKGRVIFSIANTGTASLNFLEIELIEQPMYYTILSNNRVYVGNLNSDDFDTSEFTIYTEESSSNKLPLKARVKYRDDYGKLIEQEHVIEVQLYSKHELLRYGLETPEGIGSFINYMILLIVTVFWVSMIFNLKNNKMPKTKKILWWIILIGTYVIGAVLYYLMARDKGKK
jgi:hypothetical protein